MVKWKVETEKGLYIQMTDKIELFADIPNVRSGYLICGFIQNLTQDIYNVFFLHKLYNMQFDPDVPRLFFNELNLRKIIEELKEKKYSYAWILEFYYYKLMCLFERDNEEHFSNLKSIFESNFKRFVNNENYNTLSTLTDYCLDKMDEGRFEYRKILFGLNCFRLNHNLFLTSGMMRKILYSQILQTALSVNEIKWSGDFIGGYTKYLNPAYQKSMRGLGFAMISFKLKKFEEVLDLLKNIEFVDIRDKILSKILLLKSLYELNYIENLEYQIDSSRHFFRENKAINQNLVKIHSLFINNLNRLVKLKSSLSNEKDILLKNFPGDENKIETEWLKQKAIELVSG
jgi:hypothetical protein